MKRLKLLALGALLALASACTVISPNVEAYSTLTDDSPPRPVQITAADWMDGRSLAFQQRASELAGLLAAKGYTPGDGRAPLVATYSFETHEPVMRVTTRREPVFESHFTEGRDGKISSERRLSGYRTVESETVVFPRIVRLDVVERATGQKVYEGTAHSESACKNSANVIRLLTEALAKDFPAAREGSVTVSNDTAC